MLPWQMHIEDLLRLEIKNCDEYSQLLGEGSRRANAMFKLRA